MHSNNVNRKSAVRAAKRMAAVLLALAVAVCGLPLPPLQAFGLAPGPAGSVTVDKVADWVSIPGRTDPTAQVTLSVSGEPANASSDVVIMLDRSPGMYTTWCMDPTHYVEETVIAEAAYKARTAGGSFQQVSSYLNIKITSHEAVGNAGLEKRLAGLSVTGYLEELNGAPIVQYANIAETASWNQGDWALIEQGTAISQAIRQVVVGAIGDAAFISANYPLLSPPLPVTIKRPDINAVYGCKNGFDISLYAAVDLAKTLLSEVDSFGNPVDNKVAMLSFGPGRSSQTNRYLTVMAEFSDTAAHWDTLDPSNYLSQGTNDTRYRLALEAAKYYLATEGGYDLLDPTAAYSSMLPFPAGTDIHNVSFDNELVNNPGGPLSDILDSGVLGSSGRNSAPYIILISSLMPLSTAKTDVDYTGLNVDTTGTVIHGIGLEDNSAFEFSQTLKRIAVEGYGTDEWGIPKIDNYFGHLITSTPYTYNAAYKGSFDSIKTGADLIAAFNKIPKVVRAAGYNAVITDKIQDGFVLDLSQSVIPPYKTYETTSNTITWELGEITSTPAIITYTIKAEKASPGDISPIDPSMLTGPNSILTNDGAQLDYDDATFMPQNMPFPQPALPVERIVYTVEYYLSDDFAKPVDAVTVEGVNTPLNPYIPFDQSLYDVLKYAPDYTFINDSLVEIPVFMGDGDVLKLYYQKNPKTITYTIEQYYDNEPTPRYVHTVTVPAFDDSGTVPVDFSLIPDTSDGKPRITKLADIPTLAKNGDVIRVDYGTVATWQLNYVVNYFINNVIVETKDVSVDLPVGQATANLRQDLMLFEYTHSGGLYKLDTSAAGLTDPRAYATPPQTVADGDAIDLHYVPKDRIAQYIVRYYKNPNPDPDSERTVNVTIPGDQAFIPVNLDYVEEAKVGDRYPGYTWDAGNPVFNAANNTVAYNPAGTYINLYYNENRALTKDFRFRVDYYKGGDAGDNFSRPVESQDVTIQVWAGDETYAVGLSYVPANKYAGYSQIAVFPIDRVVYSGGVVSAYYWKDGQAGTAIDYSVRYMRQNEDGSYAEYVPHRETATTTAGPDGLGVVDPAYISGTAIINKYAPGYVFKPLQSIKTTVAANEIVYVYYDIDYSKTYTVSYNVVYHLLNQGVDTVFKDILVTRDVWSGFFHDPDGNPITPRMVDYDKSYNNVNLFSGGTNPYDYLYAEYKSTKYYGGAMEDEVEDGEVVDVYYSPASTSQISYTVEYYKDNVKDPDETVTYSKTVSSGLAGFDMAPAERAAFAAKHFNGFSYIANSMRYLYPAGAESGIADVTPLFVRDGTLIKVYYASNFQNGYLIDVYKAVLNEQGDLISSTAAADAYDYAKEFRVVIHGATPDAQGAYYKQNVNVSMATSPIKLTIPAGDVYTVTEITTSFMTTPADNYRNIEIVTPGNRTDGIIDIRTSAPGYEGNVTVFNMRDKGITPPVASGIVKASKYILDDGKLVPDPAQQPFAVNLYNGISATGQYIEQIFVFDDDPQPVFEFAPVAVPGTYTVEEYIPTGLNYALIGIYDGTLPRHMQPTSGNELTFTLAAGEGKSVVILNAKGAAPPPPPNTAALNVSKILLNRDGSRYTGADNKLFGIIITGKTGTITANLSAFVSLANGENDYVMVPRGEVEITEITPLPVDVYMHEATITSDSSSGMNTNTVDMTGRDYGFATVFNTRLDTINVNPGMINVTKYVFDNVGYVNPAPGVPAASFKVDVQNSSTGEQTVTNGNTVAFEASAGNGNYKAVETDVPTGYELIGFVDAKAAINPPDPPVTEKIVTINSADPNLESASLLLFNKVASASPPPTPTPKAYLNISKVLYDEDTAQPIVNDPLHKLFTINVLRGGAIIETVNLEGGQTVQVELDRDIYTIQEEINFAPDEYGHSMIVAYPQGGAYNVVDLRNTPTGNAIAYNIKKGVPLPDGVIRVSKEVLYQGQPQSPNAGNLFSIGILDAGGAQLGGSVPQGGMSHFPVGYGSFTVTENLPSSGYSGYRIVDMYNQGNPPQVSFPVTLDANYSAAWLMVINEASSPLTIKDVGFTVEYYIDGQLDRSATLTPNGMTTDPGGLLTITPSAYEVRNKYQPYYTFDRSEYVAAAGAAATPGVPGAVVDGSVIKVYYSPAAINNAVDITLRKLLIDEEGKRITSADDSTAFEVVVSGMATTSGGTGYKRIVNLANEQQLTISVPRDHYTISENIAGTALDGKYILREVVTSGNQLNGTLDMRNRTTGDATLVNVRLNANPNTAAGSIAVTKYVFQDGVETRNIGGAQFQAVLNGVNAGGTTIATLRQNMAPGGVANTPFTPGAGNYTVTEDLSQATNYALLGIYDVNDGAGKAAASATVQLVAGQPGKAVVILNAYVPPPPPPGGGGGGGGGGGTPAVPGPGSTPSPAPIVPTPTPTIIQETPPPLAGFIPDHIQYINGYPEGDVRPDNPITRAETSAVLFRLLSDPRKHNSYTSRFADVTDDAWYAQSVKYLTSVGIVKGYPEGDFRPDNPITRAEFATLISGFDNLETADGNRFSDVDGHWAESYINSAAEKGWVTGYPDGTFKPEDNLTRAEIVTVINRMLIRAIEAPDLPAWAPSYTDIDEGHWAYTEIMEASVGHEFRRKGKGIYERWTRKLSWNPVLES